IHTCDSLLRPVCPILLFPLPLSFALICPSPRSALFPYTTLFRSGTMDASYKIICGPCPSLLSASRSLMPGVSPAIPTSTAKPMRSEEHTSELQSRFDLVCRLLLEKKNIIQASSLSVHTYARIMYL